jgi:hypothetical protein
MVYQWSNEAKDDLKVDWIFTNQACLGGCQKNQ